MLFVEQLLALPGSANYIYIYIFTMIGNVRFNGAHYGDFIQLGHTPIHLKHFQAVRILRETRRGWDIREVGGT